MIFQYRERLQVRSAALLDSIESRLGRIICAWLCLAALASATRVATSPLQGSLGFSNLAPYALLVFAPVISMLLALRWFADGDRMPQPEFRLARMGSWREISRAEAIRHPLYGAGGIMVSLLVGMLINVPVRAAEFLAATPALSGSVPSWLSTLHFLMTLDVVMLTSLYTIAFVAALRRAPFFPRLLLAVWMLDLTMQLVTAEVVARAADLPPAVAVALHSLLEGNVTKVLISVALWLPYLLLSRRVNITYRQRDAD